MITLEELQVLRKAASKAQSIYVKALRAYKRKQRELKEIERLRNDAGTNSQA